MFVQEINYYFLLLLDSFHQFSGDPSLESLELDLEGWNFVCGFLSSWKNVTQRDSSSVILPRFLGSTIIGVRKSIFLPAETMVEFVCI